jgi:hypothetical protein
VENNYQSWRYFQVFSVFSERYRKPEDGRTIKMWKTNKVMNRVVMMKALTSKQ